MQRRVLQRRRALSRAVERQHETHRAMTIGRFALAALPPKLHRPTELTSLFGLISQAFHRARPAARKVGPHGIDPVLQLAGAVEVDAIEEGAGIKCDGSRIVATRQCMGEAGDVGGDVCGVELEGGRPLYDVKHLEGLAELVQCLRQGTARVLRIAVGPEERHDAIPLHPLLRRQHDQDGDTLPVHIEAGNRSAVLFQRQAAEGFQRIHAQSGWNKGNITPE